MVPLVIQIEPQNGAGRCGACGRRFAWAGGPQLCTGDTLEPVCRDCGQEHAPALLALTTLARAAEHVGRIGRHTISPPLTALLDLARAAEDYASALPRRRLQAV